MTFTKKDFFCPRDLNESTFGITLIFSPVEAFTMALYVDIGDPTFVTVLGNTWVLTDFDLEDHVKEG